MPEIEMNSRDRMNTRTSPPSSQTGTMQRSQIAGFLILVISAILCVLSGPLCTRAVPGYHVDFKAYYYASRCFLAGCDPYNSESLKSYFIANGGPRSDDLPDTIDIVTHYIYLPTNLIFVSPFTPLPWKVSYTLWTVLLYVCYLPACFFIWRTSRYSAPVLSALAASILLIFNQNLFRVGNAVGIVVGLTATAAWCFIHNRYSRAGTIILALALMLKPQDAGFVWLFFLLAGGRYRRRALQTLAITAILSLAAAAWAFHLTPDWSHELSTNLVSITSGGGMDAPGPGSLHDRSLSVDVDLQTIAAVFHNSPPFYNLVTYMLCGIPLLLWALHVYRTSPTGNAAWFALAAVVPLEMLITYHKPYDLKLLLLLLPACFLLWAENSTRGQAAFLLTAGALFFTADLPFAVYNVLTRPVPMDLHSLAAQLKIVFLLRPIPLILIALAAFYLTIFLRQRFPAAAGGLTTGQQPDAAHTPT